MADFFNFAPDPDRAAVLDARVHRGLADSLGHILERAGSLEGLNTAGIRRVIDAVEAGKRFGPAAFGHYYELVFALLAERYDDAVAESQAFSALAPFEGPLRISILTADPDAEMALYKRRIGPDVDRRYIPPPPAQAEAFRTQLEASLRLGDRVLPEMAGEIRALVRRIVLAAAPAGIELPFTSASAYTLWGLLLLNPTTSTSLVYILQALAHESAHVLLFGFTQDEPLVLNDDSELYPSPLRDDPRPMDGVYHATFVAARMHLAMARLAACSELDSAARDEAAWAADHAVGRVKEGYAVVAEHARLTETGRALIDRAMAYMGRAA